MGCWTQFSPQAQRTRRDEDSVRQTSERPGVHALVDRRVLFFIKSLARASACCLGPLYDGWAPYMTRPSRGTQIEVELARTIVVVKMRVARTVL